MERRVADGLPNGRGAELLDAAALDCPRHSAPSWDDDVDPLLRVATAAVLIWIAARDHVSCELGAEAVEAILIQLLQRQELDHGTHRWAGGHPTTLGDEYGAQRRRTERRSVPTIRALDGHQTSPSLRAIAVTAGEGLASGRVERDAGIRNGDRPVDNCRPASASMFASSTTARRRTIQAERVVTITLRYADAHDLRLYETRPRVTASWPAQGNSGIAAFDADERSPKERRVRT